MMYNVKGQPPFLKLFYGSSVYGLTNELSDEDFMILTIDPTQPLPFKVEDDVDVWTLEEFQSKLDTHDLKALEVFYFYFDLFYNQLEMKHTFNADALRRSVSATCSNSYVKAKKKIRQGDIYIGLKSYWHCIRILTMFIHLAKYKHFNPANFKEQLRDVYCTIISCMSLPHKGDELIQLIEVDYHNKQLLKNLQHEFRMLCPLEQDNK